MTHLPNAEETDEEVVREPRRKHLADEEDVTGESRLEHDRHVRSIEQLDRVSPPLAPHLTALDRNLDPESLEVDDRSEYRDCREEVRNVRQPFPVKRLFQRAGLVRVSEQKVEESDDGSLELRSAAGVDSVW